MAALTALGAATFSWVWFAPCWLGGCAPLDDLAEYQAEGSQLLDVNGDPFATLATVNRRVVSLDSLPPILPQAFIAVEDRRFYDHGGVDFRRLMGAVISNVKAGGVAEGGSTITQQLARNLFPEWLPYTQRNLQRKLMEARVARQIERKFSKDKILELYLNHIYLGNGAYGVEAASQAYFGKPASEVELAEAAVLAALPAAPSQLDPTENPDGARERRDLVLDRMASAGFVSAADAQAAQAEEIELSSGPGKKSEGPSSSYFVEQVRREMEEIVGARIYSAGLSIHTTLDITAQTAAEEELARQLNAIESGQFGTYRHPTYASTRDDEPAAETTYLQGAVIVMDAASGEVRAMVGGRDFVDSKFNRATQMQRQAGSIFKPFVFLAALDRYGSPAQMVEDAPIRIELAGGRVWEPRNYTGRYDGPITLRDALARSKNSVTVRLAQEVGMDAVARQAEELGITTEIPSVPSAALGAADVRPIEVVRAYGAFANGGRLVEPHFIRRIVDRHGRTVWESGSSSSQALDPAKAFVLTSMLQDVVARGSGTAVRAAGFRGAAAGKTGTTNDAADVWYIGYTPELVAGIWMGLDRRETIVRGASGGTLAAPVWGRLMQRVYAGKPAPEAWQPPSGVRTAEVLRATGEIDNPECPVGGETYTEYFLFAAPAPRYCGAMYPTYTLSGDTLWGDEEWSYDLPPLDTTYSDPGAIEWPELEELRRRIRAGDTTYTGAPPAAGTGTGMPPPVAGTPVQGGQPNPPQTEEAEEEEEEETPPPATQPDEREPPRVLGEPVVRDDEPGPP
ncbi:MAG TPA: PBP1A family penicillin-binding protein [Longimicrobiaceae bacterium]